MLHGAMLRRTPSLASASPPPPPTLNQADIMWDMCGDARDVWAPPPAALLAVA